MNKVRRERIDKRKKDIAWSIAVRNKWGNKCIVCGRTDFVVAHHIIPRENKLFRWDIDNGIALCPKHHKYSYEISAHKNPFIFYSWLEVLDGVMLINLKTKFYKEMKLTF